MPTLIDYKQKMGWWASSLIILLICGCAPTPVNDVAVKHCLDKGWIPLYFSNFATVQFDCHPQPPSN